VGVAFGLSAASQQVAASIAPPLLGAIGITLQYLAVTELKRQDRQTYWIWLPVLSVCVAYVWFEMIQPNITLRLVVFNAIRVVMMLRIASSFAQRENGRRQFVDMLAAGTYLLLAISAIGVILDFLLRSHLTVGYNFESTRTVYNAASMAVAQALLFTLFLLAITERLNGQLREEAMHDPVTSLFNRRAIEEIGSHQTSLSLRTGQVFSAFMIDVDDFKRVNDSHGHATGDRVLKSVAVALRGTLRDEDYVGRWGGDEFCALLPGATCEEAKRVAGRILKSCETHTFMRDQESISLSLSIGVATIDISVGSFDRLMAIADAALYRAKEAGKGRYAVADPALYTCELVQH
jgi:diguanylate cyclase (GGDEF)-like protein